MILVGLVTVLAIGAILLVQKNKGEEKRTAVNSASISESASMVGISKTNASVANSQSAAKAKYKSEQVSKNVAASASTAAKEVENTAAEANNIDFANLSEIDQAKTAILYGLGNMSYFQDKAVVNYIGNDVYGSTGVDVTEISDMYGVPNGVSYLVTQPSAMDPAESPIFSYINLGVGADGKRPEGITFGRLSGGAPKKFEIDPSLSSVGITYSTLSDWINTHGGLRAIKNIHINKFVSQ